MADTFAQYRSDLKPFSRSLRRNLTDAKQLVWSKIRRKQLADCQFYRQKPFGTYILDFYCPNKKLVIELDGGQHYLEQGKANDHKRDEYLTAHGLTVMRFSNREIMEELERIVAQIYATLTSKNLPCPHFYAKRCRRA